MKVCGGKIVMKTTEMETKMLDKRRKKNRRGKKRPNTKDVATSGITFNDTKTIGKGTRKGQNFLRPYSSPKAPMNSTQFLIEDSGNDLIDIDDYSRTSSPGQNMSYLSDLEKLVETDESFYDENGQNDKYCDIDDEYVPMCLDETADFMRQDFEKQYTSIQSDVENQIELKHLEFKFTPKEELVDSLMKMEDAKNEQEQCEEQQRRLKSEIKLLREQNSQLEAENKFLRTLLE